MAGSMNEELQSKKIVSLAEAYYDKYRAQMDLLGKSVLAKVKKGVSEFDVYALGKQLESFDAYRQLCEENGNVNLLGQIPNVAYDVITAVHGASILPIVASVQPIDEERGTVYFRQVRTTSVKGSQGSAPSVVVDPRSNIVTPSGYSSNHLDGEAATVTIAAQVAYSFTLAAFPIRSETLSFTVSALPNVLAKDIGNGQIYGIGLSGTVNYLTGQVNLLFAADPGAGKTVFASYQQNYELAADLPKIDSFFASSPIHARVYALKSNIGMLQSFGMRKRFGLTAEDEMAKELVQEINREIGGDMVRKLRAVAVGSTTYNDTPPNPSISVFEHRQTYKYKLADAESTLLGNAGRGTIALLIVGRQHAALIGTLPGFVKMTDGNSLGSHVYGTLDGITVIRVMEANVLGSNEGIALWKGATPFEAAAVYSPYMPLTVTGTLPEAPNPLLQMRAAAVWAGVEAVVPNYATKFDIIP